jgi:hypothetical protein
MAVSYPVAQVGCQLSGGEIARLTGASRPKPGIRLPKSSAAKRSLAGASSAVE